MTMRFGCLAHASRIFASISEAATRDALRAGSPAEDNARGLGQDFDVLAERLADQLEHGGLAGARSASQYHVAATMRFLTVMAAVQGRSLTSAAVESAGHRAASIDATAIVAVFSSSTPFTVTFLAANAAGFR